MTKHEKIYKLCCQAMCFIPFLFILISDLLSFSATTHKVIWQIIFGMIIILLLLSFKIEKHLTKKEKVLNLMILILVIGYSLFDGIK